jgi:hypothetical protein
MRSITKTACISPVVVLAALLFSHCSGPQPIPSQRNDTRGDRATKPSDVASESPAPAESAPKAKAVDSDRESPQETLKSELTGRLGEITLSTSESETDPSRSIVLMLQGEMFCIHPQDDKLGSFDPARYHHADFNLPEEALPLTVNARPARPGSLESPSGMGETPRL